MKKSTEIFFKSAVSSLEQYSKLWEQYMGYENCLTNLENGILDFQLMSALEKLEAPEPPKKITEIICNSEDYEERKNYWDIYPSLSRIYHVLLIRYERILERFEKLANKK